jgi:hypothetical protein
MPAALVSSARFHSARREAKVFQPTATPTTSRAIQLQLLLPTARGFKAAKMSEASPQSAEMAVIAEKTDTASTNQRGWEISFTRGFLPRKRQPRNIHTVGPFGSLEWRTGTPHQARMRRIRRQWCSEETQVRTAGRRRS